LGCVSGIRTLSLQVKPTPNLSLTGNTLVCEGDSTALFVSGASSYTWNTGAQTTSVSIIATATNSFTASGTNALTGCVGTTTLQFNAAVCTNLIQTDKAGYKLAIAPNPVGQMLYVSGIADHTQPINYTIKNVLGSVVQSGATEHEEIMLNSLPTGIYFLVIGNQTVKFVKE